MGVWFWLRTAQGVVCPHCRATHRGEALIWLLVVVEITPHSDCKTPRERERGREREAVEGKGEAGTHTYTVPHKGQVRLTLNKTMQNWKSYISAKQATNQTVNTESLC